MKTVEQFAAIILLIGCIVFPYDYYVIKLPILAWFIIQFIIKIILTGKLEISMYIFALFMMYILSGIFFILRGIFVGNASFQSIFYTSALYIIYPAIFLIIVSSLPKEFNLIVIFEKILKLGLILTSLVMIAAYLNSKYGMFKFMDIMFDNLIVDSSDEVVKINYHGISSLLFLFPYFLAKYVFDQNKTLKKFLIQLFVLIISITAIFLSGRRALLILFFFSIFLTFLFKVISLLNENLKINKNIFVISVLMVLVLFPVMFKIQNSKMIKVVKSTILYSLNLDNDISSKTSDNERIKQIINFSEKIIEKPILGYGHGSVIKEVIRSKEKPWRYEMSYFDLVFHTGFFGFFLYSIGPIWIMVSLIILYIKREKYKSFTIAVLIAFFSMLIAFATNPYLNAFDIQWAVYFPLFYVIVINQIPIKDRVCDEN